MKVSVAKLNVAGPWRVRRNQRNNVIAVMRGLCEKSPPHCTLALGQKLPVEIQQTEKTKKTKAQLIQALTASGDACDKAHATLSGARGAEMMDWFGVQHPRVTVLFFNSSHAWEHYGNIVTYLRLKGIVPPSSEPRKPPSGDDARDRS
jgi:hypothetical protein